jgi:hypothetical protein
VRSLSRGCLRRSCVSRRGSDWRGSPIAGMLVPTFTHTARNQDAPPLGDAHTNNNTILQQASLFYGGKIYGNLGAFIQGTYDRESNHTFLDNTDIRYADTTKILDFDVLYGVTVNNNPTVQDVWNTTPAWGFPYIASTIAPQFAPPGTTIEGSLAGKFVGTGVYTFWNDMLYLEGSAYQNLSKQTLEALGEPNIDGTNSIRRAAPYCTLVSNFLTATQSAAPRPIGALLSNTTSGNIRSRSEHSECTPTSCQGGSPASGLTEFWMSDLTPNISTLEIRTVSRRGSLT